jgi:hypothetical protein
VSYASGPRLPAEVGFGVATYTVAPYGLWALSIKKSLAGMLVQVGTHVPNARAHVFKTSDIRAIMGLQDVRADSAVNDCKTCRQAGTVRLRCIVSTINMGHSTDTVTMPSDSTARCHTVDRVQRVK